MRTSVWVVALRVELHLNELNKDAQTIVFCAGGHRSSVGASVLRQAGFIDVSDILGGYGAWNELVPVPP